MIKQNKFTFLGFVDKLNKYQFDLTHPEGIPGQKHFEVIKNKIPTPLRGKLASIQFQIYRTEVHHVRTVMSIMDFLG